VACKSWRALIADPSFLLRCWPENVLHLSSLVGLFGQQQSSDGSWISGPPTFIPAPRSPIVPGRCFPNSSFGPCTCTASQSSSAGPCTACLLETAQPLVSRQGLLLLRFYPKEYTGAHLAVWDLFAGTCDMIPPPQCELIYSIKTCAILMDGDYSS
jgi:hypothetical protein